MIDSHDWGEPIDDGSIDGVEMMVRAAGNYVRASNDLRPRVLETARTARGEQRAQRRIQRAAVFFVLLAMFIPSAGHPSQTTTAYSQTSLATIGAESVFSQAEAKAAHGGDFGWGMVEAFTELRRRQAEALRPTL